MITAVDGCIYLEHEMATVCGYRFFGTPFIPPISDWAFMLKAEERKLKFESIPSDTEVLITHTPPKGIQDAKPDAPEKFRYGCPFLLEQVQ